MSRVAANTHLSIAWLFEPAERPYDWDDYCLGWVSTPRTNCWYTCLQLSVVRRALVPSLGASSGEVSLKWVFPAICATWQCRIISFSKGKPVGFSEVRTWNFWAQRFRRFGLCRYTGSTIKLQYCTNFGFKRIILHDLTRNTQLRNECCSATVLWLILCPYKQGALIYDWCSWLLLVDVGSIFLVYIASEALGTSVIQGYKIPEPKDAREWNRTYSP